jgi:DNA-binding IscR family transcriptional regulator
MLSKKGKYAIKALLAPLASENREGPMRIADLAPAEQIPPKFLELRDTEQGAAVVRLTH